MGKIFRGKTDIPPKVDPDPDGIIIRLKVQSHGMANMVRTSITGCVFFLLGAFDPMLLLLIVCFGKKNKSIFRHI